MKALSLLWLVAGTALASDADVLRCRQLSEPAQRLACYDAMVLAPAGQRAVTTASATAPVLQQTPEEFGVEYRSDERRLQSIDSRIVGAFQGWSSRGSITLANGQVWQVVDDSIGVVELNNPKVTVRRGAMGAFYLEIDGTNRSPKVRRIR